MEKTSDYNKFKFLDLNRSLDRRCINALKNSILKNGYIGSPILVNDKYEILDGQHRFVALKESGMEIPYQVVDNGYDAIIDLNTTQHNWGIEDYINYYCEKNYNQHYIRLKRLCNEFNTSPTNILIMAFRKRPSGQNFVNIKKGNLKLTIDDELRMRNFYQAFKQISKLIKIKPTTRLCSALAELSCKPKFRWKILVEKASKYPTMAYNCRTMDEFVIMLTNLYNYKAKKEENKI